MDLMTTSEVGLKHHGIDGMKWGVWNEETRGRYSEGKEHSKSSEERAADYDNLLELTQGDIEDFYNSGRISGWGSKSGMQFYDTIPEERLDFDETTTFTSWGSDNKVLDGPLYTTWKDDAESTYRNFGPTMYELVPKKKLTVASMKDSYDTYSDLFSDDASFRKDIYKTMLSVGGTPERVEAYASAASSYPDGAAACAYKSFVHNQYRGSDSTKKFFSTMLDKGFDGVLDQNDIDDYTKDSPVIVLDPVNSLELKNEVSHSALFEDESVFLQHHGTLGMKWGRWNEETRRRYMHLPRKAGSLMKKGVNEAGSAAKKGAVKVAKVAKGKIEARTAEREARKAEKAELSKQRKELGMTRAKYEKLREQTLKSHDPTVVAKGMHTLTDKELDAKIIRLQKEETISKLSTSKETRKHNERKARSEAIQANPAYKIGKQILDKKINQWLDKKVGDGTSNVVEEAKKQAKKTKNEGDKAQQEETSKSTSSQQYSNSWSYPSDGVKFPKQLVGKVEKAASNPVNSESSKRAAEKGRAYVDNDIIDVTPIDSSSARRKH